MKKALEDRLKGYLHAVERGDTDRYHDYQDVHKGKMTIAEYNKKWRGKNGYWIEGEKATRPKIII